MVVDLRQVTGGFLTFSMFLMLGNMVKRDHIDPLLEPMTTSSVIHYGALKGTKPGLMKLKTSGPWKDRKEAGKPCWKTSSLMKKDQSDGYIFFSLANAPEYHASQVANAVAVARYFGATLALPDIKGIKGGEARKFGEVYDVDKFIASLNGIVQVDKNPPTDLSKEKLSVIKVPNRVSEDFIDSKIKPIFQNKRNVKIATMFNSSTVGQSKKNRPSNAYQCLAMFESLKLNTEMQQLVDSMIGTLRNLNQKMGGRFVAVDLKAEVLEAKGCQQAGNATLEKRCYNAEEIGRLLENVGFSKETFLYVTQTGWHASLNTLRDVFPNTFTKDAIMPADEKAKFMGAEGHKYEKIIDYYMCAHADTFVPASHSRFYAGVVGERIGLGRMLTLVPLSKDSNSTDDYLSPYIARKSHFAHSCFC